MTFYAEILSGILTIFHKEEMDKWVSSQKDGKFEITFKKPSSKRSVEQNKLWWMYVTILADEKGYTKEEMHEICKMKFLKREKVDEQTGETFEYLKSTTKLTKLEFAELINQLQIWAAQSLGIVLPEPSDQFKIKV